MPSRSAGIEAEKTSSTPHYIIQGVAMLFGFGGIVLILLQMLGFMNSLAEDQVVRTLEELMLVGTAVGLILTGIFFQVLNIWLKMSEEYD